jgi:predicted RNase H-like HicB family nuclease
MKKDFMVVFEVGKKGFGAFAPDIQGCFAVGPTLEVTRQRYLEAVKAHLNWMASDHDPMPKPATTAFDFARSTGKGKKRPSFYIEWLPISVPAQTRRRIPA